MENIKDFIGQHHLILIGVAIVIIALILMTFMRGFSLKSARRFGHSRMEESAPPDDLEEVPSPPKMETSVELPPAQDSVMTAPETEEIMEEHESMRPSSDNILDNEMIVPLLFGTNRNQLKSKPDQIRFGGMSAELSFGNLEVSIPIRHEMGALERPAKWKIWAKEKRGKHILVYGGSKIDKNEFVKELQNSVDGTPKGRAVLFIHGFNTTFDEGARRAAQIAYDLFANENTPGGEVVVLPVTPLYYSWPSKGGTLDYSHDQTRADQSVTTLKAFLTVLSKDVKIDELTIIAHSMGNRVLTRALNDMGNIMGSNGKPFIKQIVLAAPDIDRQVFKGLVAAIKRTGERITVYASRNDKALKASILANGYPRLGDAAPPMPLYKNVDMIDASTLGEDMLGHTYVAEKPMLYDVCALIKKGDGPDERTRLAKVETNDGRYWKFKA